MLKDQAARLWQLPMECLRCVRDGIVLEDSQLLQDFLENGAESLALTIELTLQEFYSR